MKYEKPTLSFDEQADLLIKRGLIVEKPLLIERLKSVNYYRFSGYLYPYRQADETFKAGTTFEQVWRHYVFDRRLRLTILDAIERVEVSVKTQFIYQYANKNDAFAYMNSSSFPNLKPEKHKELIGKIMTEADRSKEAFVLHFKEKYGDSHSNLPLWMVGEIMPFGCILTMFKGSSNVVRNKIAAYYGVPADVLESWLITINVIRNICAHHSRLWNRVLGVKPRIPKRK